MILTMFNSDHLVKYFFLYVISTRTKRGPVIDCWTSCPPTFQFYCLEHHQWFLLTLKKSVLPYSLLAMCRFLAKCFFSTFPGLCWLCPWWCKLDTTWSLPTYYLDWLVLHHLLFLSYWSFIIVLVLWLLISVNGIAVMVGT